jgi:hypothetical protein
MKKDVGTSILKNDRAGKSLQLKFRRTLAMDKTERKMTKIARELNKLTVQTMKEEGIGTAEFDFIHLVRHHPGITQAQLREELKIDKGAAARRAASLEAKGYLIRRNNPEDKRSQLLYATKKAEGLKNSKVSIESTFYEWLMEELDESETEHFCEMLDRLYLRSKKESRSGFLQVKERMGRGEKDG